MIVKIQRPVVTNDGAQPWLIYNESRSYYAMIAGENIPAEVKKAMGEDYKAYFNTAWKGRALAVNERIAAQDW